MRSSLIVGTEEYTGMDSADIISPKLRIVVERKLKTNCQRWEN